jgi:hypothetical protein
MKKNMKGIATLLFAAVISLGLGACGTGNEDIVVGGGANPAQSANVFVKTGIIVTDSWGYTGSNPVQVAVPSQTEILIEGHTLFVDASHTVVSGATNSRISFSSDKTTLPASAQASIPVNANFISYVNISLGSARTAFPDLSVTVDVGAVLSGTTLTVYNYDADTGKWTSAQTAVVSSLGKITFPVDQLSLWGIFQ